MRRLLNLFYAVVVAGRNMLVTKLHVDRFRTNHSLALFAPQEQICDDRIRDITVVSCRIPTSSRE
jgi:hypothetical protein